MTNEQHLERDAGHGREKWCQAEHALASFVLCSITVTQHRGTWMKVSPIEKLEDFTYVSGFFNILLKKKTHRGKFNKTILALAP